jgi:hypothetical protein
MVIYRGAMAIDTRVPGVRFPLHDLPKVSRANGPSVGEPRETVGKRPGAQMPVGPAAVYPSYIGAWVAAMLILSHVYF